MRLAFLPPIIAVALSTSLQQSQAGSPAPQDSKVCSPDAGYQHWDFSHETLVDWDQKLSRCDSLNEASIDGECDSARIEKVETPEGKVNAAHFVLKPGDFISNGYRSELADPYCSTPGNDVWYSYEVMIPDKMPEFAPGAYCILGQIHDQDSKRPGYVKKSEIHHPPVAVRFDGDGLSVRAYRQPTDSDKELLKTAHPDERNAIKVDTFPLAPSIEREQWYKVKIHTHLSPDKNGRLEVWIDGNKKVDYSGPVGYDHTGGTHQGSYLKIGVYCPMSPPTAGEKFTAYYKNVTRSAKDPDLHSSVASALANSFFPVPCLHPFSMSEMYAAAKKDAEEVVSRLHPGPRLIGSDSMDSQKLSNVWNGKIHDTNTYLPGRITKAADPLDPGKPVLKITVHPGDHPEPGEKSERSELMESPELWSQEGKTYSYSFRTLIPKDFPANSHRLVLAQWKQWCMHTECPNPPGIKVQDSPVLALRYVDGELFITLQQGSERKELFQTKEDVRNKWLNFKFNVRFARDGSGVINATLNGKQIISYKGQTAYRAADGYPGPKDRYYFKTGLYRDPGAGPMTIYEGPYTKKELSN